MRTLATKQQALLKPKPTETQCYSIYQCKENQAMLKARNRVKQPRTFHACLEQFSRSILTLEDIWHIFYYMISLSSNSTEKVFARQMGNRVTFQVTYYRSCSLRKHYKNDPNFLILCRVCQLFTSSSTRCQIFALFQNANYLFLFQYTSISYKVLLNLITRAEKHSNNKHPL